MFRRILSNLYSSLLYTIVFMAIALGVSAILAIVWYTFVDLSWLP